MKIKILVVTIALSLTACATKPPRNVASSCDMLDEKGGWYKATKRVRDKYGTPIHVQLAIIRQESSFRHNARTDREYLLWVIPWGRKSTAYGYAQVKDATWDWYKDKTGNKGADRDRFEDAVDFIGWYSDISQRTLGISKWDAYNQYLAYHEGHGGFKRRTYLKKKWLVNVAKKVDGYSKTYAAQLSRCEDDLDSGFSLWPF
jgi:hypothetical protein